MRKIIREIGRGQAGGGPLKGALRTPRRGTRGTPRAPNAAPRVAGLWILGPPRPCGAPRSELRGSAPLPEDSGAPLARSRPRRMRLGSASRGADGAYHVHGSV